MVIPIAVVFCEWPLRAVTLTDSWGMSLSFPRLWTGSASDSCAAEGTTLALAFDSPSGLGEPPSSPSPCLRPLLADHVGFFAAPCVRVMARSITRDFFFLSKFAVHWLWDGFWAFFAPFSPVWCFSAVCYFHCRLQNIHSWYCVKIITGIIIIGNINYSNVDYDNDEWYVIRIISIITVVIIITLISVETLIVLFIIGMIMICIRNILVMDMILKFLITIIRYHSDDLLLHYLLLS